MGGSGPSSSVKMRGSGTSSSVKNGGLSRGTYPICILNGSNPPGGGGGGGGVRPYARTKQTGDESSLIHQPVSILVFY